MSRIGLKAALALAPGQTALRPEPYPQTRRKEKRMGIFSRLAQLIKSNLNDLISRSEDPEKMLNQVVLDMNNQLVEAKKQVAASIADEKRLAKQFEQEAARAQEWERRAMLALRAGNEALAKEALVESGRAMISPRRSETSGPSRRPRSISSRPRFGC